MPSTDFRQISYDFTDEYQAEFSPDPPGVVITMVLQTDWNSNALFFFPGDMLGTQVQAGGRISRTAPEKHPIYSSLYATRCELMRGIGAVEESGGNVRFFNSAGGDGKARWAVTYSDLGYDVRSNEATYDGGANSEGEIRRNVRKRSQSSTEVLPIHGATWVYSSDGQTISEPGTLLLATGALEYTHFFVPAPIPEATWKAALGKVNLTAFDPREPGANHPIGTVYYQSYEKEPLVDAGGNRVYHVTHRFLIRRDGWNRFWRNNKAGGPGFETITDKATGTKTPYETTDLNLLFSV